MPEDFARPAPLDLPPKRPSQLSSDKLFEILWHCATQAFIMAFTVGILGSIAIGILSGICGDMTPSLPPGLDGDTPLRATASHWWNASRTAIHRHSFAVLWFILFGCKSALALARYSNAPHLRDVAARVLWITHRLSRDWFSLLIKNAFAAFIGVLVLQIVQNLSLTHLLWEAVKSLVQPLCQSAGHLFGGSLYDLLARWLNWYGDNQTKFSFWLLYSAALCDDLGLPNYKTLARRLWARALKTSPHPTLT
jgi:hypothetical protein